MANTKKKHTQTTNTAPEPILAQAVGWIFTGVMLISAFDMFMH